MRRTEYDGSTGSYVVSRDEKWLHSGWTCLAELNATNDAVVRTYLWGLDLSGTLTGAGGVGGLLAVNSAVGGVHFAAYDGNGNVESLVNAADCTVSAVYEYGPFGQTLRATGPMAYENPWRFSTKRADDALELVLYECRAYSPAWGRWLSRDPMCEFGGANLLAFIRNRAISSFDPLGLQEHGPQDFRPICDMANRLKAEINRLPQESLKRLFLQTQACILDRLCNSHCCLTEATADWLRRTVRDFMNPLFSALDGNGDDRWRSTLSVLDNWQESTDLTGALDDTGGAGETGGAAIAGEIIDWTYALFAAREMAITHIDQDLRSAIRGNGVGLNYDWECIGNQVSQCERQFFSKFERFGSKILGLARPSFDVSRFRDAMRADEIRRLEGVEIIWEMEVPFPIY